ncbi:MAG TPA: hypothetical protein VFB31_14685 [Pseudolabrys sp.]|nr:hypothetical protein [Pseudolabrys sp.]
MAEQWIDVEWVKSRLSQTGKTQRELAAGVGLDPSAISRLLDGRRRLRADEIPKFRAFFEQSASSHTTTPSPRPGTTTTADDAQVPWLLSKKQSRPGPRPRERAAEPIAVLGPLRRLRGGFFELGEIVTEYRARPPQLIGVPGAFALCIPDDGMEPRYSVGEVIYVHPHKPLLLHSWIVLRWQQPAGRLAIGRLIDMDEAKIRIEDPKHRQTFDRAEIAQVGRIIVSAAE